MNIRITALILAAALPCAALASPPEPTTVTIDCHHPQLPSQQTIARLTGVDNFSKVYDVRTRLMIEAAHACQGGAGQIQLTLEAREPTDKRVAER
jgi:hypothetical protein